MEDFLDKLDTSDRSQKHDTENTFTLNDEKTEQSNEFLYKQGKFDVKTTIDNVEVPLKSGSPGFSIHASKVYILYPSLFQDPNIFGRFSIPQSINVEPFSENTVTKSSLPANLIQQPENSNVYGNTYPREEKKLFRREAEGISEPPPQQQTQRVRPSLRRKAEKKRNVETHLTGTVVVLNQDVNENNQKESFY